MIRITYILNKINADNSFVILLSFSMGYHLFDVYHFCNIHHLDMASTPTIVKVGPQKWKGQWYTKPNVASIHQLDENVISRKRRTKKMLETLQDISNKCSSKILMNRWAHKSTKKMRFWVMAFYLRRSSFERILSYYNSKEIIVKTRWNMFWRI